MNLTSRTSSVDITDAEFEALATIAAREAGLSIPLSKKSLVQSRVARRLRMLNIETCHDYLSLVADSPIETRELISVLTTNVSSFYRERHHFEFLRETVFPSIANQVNSGGRVRIWSAGCSSGQEPYTIAMECFNFFPDVQNQDLLVLATDIDPTILKRAKSGEFSEDDLSVLSQENRERFFSKHGATPGTRQASDTLKNMVRFRELNLHGAWPMPNAFDVIFCRNVVIYFDEEHQRALWPRFREQLKPDGWFFLGHSERIQDVANSGFKNAGVTIYQRT
jgi:chemotaxis protein methyltransferase CheR